MISTQKVTTIPTYIRNILDVAIIYKINTVETRRLYNDMSLSVTFHTLMDRINGLV